MTTNTRKLYWCSSVINFASFSNQLHLVNAHEGWYSILWSELVLVIIRYLVQYYTKILFNNFLCISYLYFSMSSVSYMLGLSHKILQEDDIRLSRLILIFSASCSADMMVKLWDFQSYECVRTMRGKFSDTWIVYAL